MHCLGIRIVGLARCVDKQNPLAMTAQQYYKAIPECITVTVRAVLIEDALSSKSKISEDYNTIQPVSSIHAENLYPFLVITA